VAIMWLMQPGTVGLVKDLHGVHMLPEAWSDVKNVVFNHGHVHKSEGLGIQLDTFIPPYGIYRHKAPSQSVFAYMGLQKV